MSKATSLHGFSAVWIPKCKPASLMDFFATLRSLSLK